MLDECIIILMKTSIYNQIEGNDDYLYNFMMKKLISFISLCPVERATKSLNPKSLIWCLIIDKPWGKTSNKPCENKPFSQKFSYA